MAVNLCRHPVGCFTNPSPRAYVPAPSEGQDDSPPPPCSVCVSVFVFLSPPLFAIVSLSTLHTPELSWTALPPNSCQTPCTPPPRRPSEQTKKQTMQEEKFQRVFRETCSFKGRSKVPLELITVVGELRRGAAQWIPGDGEIRKAGWRGWHKKCSLDIFKL